MKKVNCLKAVILLSLVSFCVAIFLIPSFSLAEEQEPSPNPLPEHLWVFKSDGTTPAVEGLDYTYTEDEIERWELEIKSDGLIVKGDGNKVASRVKVLSDYANVINEITFDSVNFENLEEPYDDVALTLGLQANDKFNLNISNTCIFNAWHFGITVSGPNDKVCDLVINGISDASVLNSSCIDSSSNINLFFVSSLHCKLGNSSSATMPMSCTDSYVYVKDNAHLEIDFVVLNFSTAIYCKGIYFEDNSYFTSNTISRSITCEDEGGIAEFNTNGNISINTRSHIGIVAYDLNIINVGKFICIVEPGTSVSTSAFDIDNSININCGNVFLSGCEDGEFPQSAIVYPKDAIFNLSDDIHVFGSNELNDFSGSTKNVIFKLVNDDYYTCFIEEKENINDDFIPAKSVVFVKEEPPGPGPTPGPTPDPSSDVSGTGSAQTGDFTPMSTLLLLALLALPSLFMLRRKLNNRIN